MISLSTLLNHYKRDEIQQAIINNSSNREVATRFGGGGFGKRPDILSYPGDVLELVKQGATSFHASEELWRNPLHLDPNLRRKELDNLRIGWDLLLDIDCPFLEYSQIAAELLVDAIKHQGVNSVTTKFSGNHGFHIGVPFKAFPDSVQGTDTKLLFPEGPRRIAAFLKEMIRAPLASKILEYENLNSIIQKTGKTFKELVINNQFDPFVVLEIDTVLISSRHLFRMPYCFNEKSGLVSIGLDKVEDFDKNLAKPENVQMSKTKFLDDENTEAGEAKRLIIESFDFLPEKEEEEKTIKKEYTEIGSAISVELFPPCVKNILKGMDDGKKRAVFIMINFLTNVGWNYEEIEKFLHEWNKKNGEPLREQLFVGQIRYHKQQRKKILPPNCKNTMYYQDLHICTPDNFCQKIKNPVNYSILKARAHKKEKKPKKQ
ncbi:DNA primase small subunit domain-containing protein [Nanoarchaeota archaeon]